MRKSDSQPRICAQLDFIVYNSQIRTLPQGFVYLDKIVVREWVYLDKIAQNGQNAVFIVAILVYVERDLVSNSERLAITTLNELLNEVRCQRMLVEVNDTFRNREIVGVRNLVQQIENESQNLRLVSLSFL